MNGRRTFLVAVVLAAVPGLAAGYTYGTASPNGSNVQQNQVTGKPVIWYNPDQTFFVNFGGDYDASAASAMAEWNAVGTPLQWSLGSTAAEPCNSTDHINSAGWRSSPCDATDASAGYGDAIAVTKRSYQKIGDVWYFADADIVVDRSKNWQIYSGPLKQGTQDFHRVILHELGHALGLDHPNDAGQHVTAIMNSQISAIDSLQQDDRDGITFLYAGVGDTASNTAKQIDSSSGGGGGGWILPLLAFAARLWRADKTV
jgi:hypothetical protein